MIALVKIPIEFLITSAGEKKKLYASIDLDYHSKIRITIRGYDERYYREGKNKTEKKKTKKYWMFTQEFTPLTIYVTNYSSTRFAYSNDSF